MARPPAVSLLEVASAVAKLRQQGVTTPSKYALRKALKYRGSYGYLQSCLDRIADQEAAGLSLETLAEADVPSVAPEHDAVDRSSELAVSLAERLEPVAQQLLGAADQRAQAARTELMPRLEAALAAQQELEAALADARSGHDQLVSALDSAEAARAVAQQDLTTTTTQNAVLHDRVEQLQARVVAAEQVAAREREELAHERVAFAERFAAKERELQSAREGHRLQRDVLRTQLREVEQTLASRQQELAHTAATLDGVLRERSELERGLQRLQGEVAELRARLDAGAAQREALAAEAAAISQQLALTRSESQSRADLVERLEVELQQRREERTAWLAQQDRLQTTIEQLQAELRAGLQQEATTGTT